MRAIYHLSGAREILSFRRGGHAALGNRGPNGDRARMCVVALAWQVHPDWPLILIGNRDEFHDRPSAPLGAWDDGSGIDAGRSEEHTSELQSLMRISYAVFCLKKKNNKMS